MEKTIPQRQCLGCGQRKDKSDLIRVVKTPEGEIKLDRSGRMNGRGAYICPQGDCLTKAFKTKGLNRAFKMEVSQVVYDSLKEELQ